MDANMIVIMMVVTSTSRMPSIHDALEIYFLCYGIWSCFFLAQVMDVLMSFQSSAIEDDDPTISYMLQVYNLNSKGNVVCLLSSSLL